MFSFPGVLLLVAAVLASASAQSVCQTGWTQAPSTSDWGSKCYRELGPPERYAHATPTVGGYNHSACNVACRAVPLGSGNRGGRPTDRHSCGALTTPRAQRQRAVGAGDLAGLAFAAGLRNN